MTPARAAATLPTRLLPAWVAKLVDAPDSKSGRGDPVRVRVSPQAPNSTSHSPALRVHFETFHPRPSLRTSVMAHKIEQIQKVPAKHLWRWLMRTESPTEKIRPVERAGGKPPIEGKTLACIPNSAAAPCSYTSSPADAAFDPRMAKRSEPRINHRHALPRCHLASRFVLGR